MELIMKKCIYCETELSERGSFCKSCGKQSSCTNCNDALDTDATFCVVCGTKVGNVIKQVSEKSAFGNVFELNETSEGNGGKATREIKLACSDAAVSNFGEFVERRLRTPQFATPTNGRAQDTDEIQRTLPPVTSAHGGGKMSDERDEKDIAPPPPGGSELEILHTIFRKDGESWKLDEIYLNATGKGDYGKRLTFLFLYLKELEGTEKTPRSALNKILEDSTVFDGNLRGWLAKEAAINNEDDMLSLNAAGRRTAKGFIQNILGEKVEGQWLPGMSTAKRSSSKGSSQGEGVDKDPSKKSGGKQNPTAKTLVGKWKTTGLDVNGHAVFASKSDLDKGLLALWAIRRATADEIKEVSSQGMMSFLFQAFEIKIHKRSLERALDSKEAAGVAVKIRGTTFQILPPGIQKIETAFGIKK